MSKEKQIEEMVKDLCDIDCKGMKCNICDYYGCEYRMQAESLYNAGYRRQREGEWISVEERLPEKDGRYLVAMKDGDKYHISTRRFKRAEPPIWYKGHTFGYWAKQTYGVRFWMLLPEAPKGD